MAKTHDVDVYVRFCETDAAGHVNNVSYFMYLEEARTKLFKEMGMGVDSDTSLSFIIASTKCDYVAQAYAGEQLQISSAVEQIGTKSFRIKHMIKNVDMDTRIAEGSATMVCFNYEEQKTVSIPNFLRKNLESKMTNHPVG